MEITQSNPLCSRIPFIIFLTNGHPASALTSNPLSSWELCHDGKLSHKKKADNNRFATSITTMVTGIYTLKCCYWVLTNMSSRTQ